MSNVSKFRPPQSEPEADTFEDFWRHVPTERRRGKAKCRVLFNRIIQPGGTNTRTLCRDSNTYIELHLEATPRQLIDGWKAYIRTQRDPNTYGLRDGGKFTCLPETFLNQDRWQDFQ